MVSQWVVLVSCVYPMLRSDWLSLALCQFVLSPSLWLTAYLSTVKVVHCAYCSTLCIHCQEVFSSFWFSLSSYHSVVNPLPVAFSMCGVLSSSTLSTLHYRWIVCRKVRGGVPFGVPSVSSLTVHIVSRRVAKVNKKFAIFWGEILFAWYTLPPVGYPNCQP